MSRLESRLLHYPMKDPLFVTERTALVAATQGRVLEICFETDKNVHYYSPWVTNLAIVCLEGAPGASRHDTNDRGLRVERIFCGSEATSLPFEDSSFDWAVSALTLCRTKNTGAILAEVRRVLKPSGGYLFLEHGRSADPAMARWQHRLRKLWLGYGGCDLDREIDQMIVAAGFRIEKMERFQFGQPKFLSTMARGLARRR
jgi:SAM-dependent methyltransferase